MEFLTFLYTYTIEQLTLLPNAVLILLAVCALLFVVQLYLRIFVWRIPKTDNSPQQTQLASGVSVVVVIHENDQSYIESGMMDILRQNYSPFELVVVDCSYDEYIGQRLEAIKKEYYNLRVTTLRKGSGFDNCEKLALNIGFKAAIYDNLLVTTSKAYSVSEKWIESMSSSFGEQNKQIVIGYSTIEPTNKMINYFARSTRLLAGMGYLSAANKGAAYRGSRHNLGYTRDIYFASKGFNYLNMNIGDNDLFIQKIANKNNTAINLSAEASIKEFSFSSWREMFGNDALRARTYDLYPTKVKLRKNLEVFTRTGFHLVALALIAWLVKGAINGQIFIPIYIGVGIMILLRLLAVAITVNKASKRVNDKGLTAFFMIHDLVSPIYEFSIWLNRRFSHNRSAWR